MTIQKLTPNQFKARYRGKGWTGVALAQRWGKGREWISRIANDSARDQHWDDAVEGLPDSNDQSPRAHSPAEFKARYKGKGWTGIALASHWGKGREWISRIANDPDREQHWNDAVIGLPWRPINVEPSPS